MKTYKIYFVEGYELYTPKDDLYHDVKRIEVIAENEKEALKKAEKALTCRYYKVRGVYEKPMDL